MYSVAAHKIFMFASVGLALMNSFASASDLKGRVVNGTTGTATIDEQVVLLGPSENGMNEIARIRTDRGGRFRLQVNGPQGTNVVRVGHDGVTYHQIVPPDGGDVTIEVYDVSASVEGISAVMDVERFEAIGDQLEVKQLVTIRNESKPPRTLVKDRSFEAQLPADAKVQYGMIQVENAPPLKQRPLASDRPSEYYFVFPVRPGDTRFAVVYRVPYTGQATIHPTVRNAGERFVAMLPKSMKFEPIDARMYHPMENTTPDNVQTTEPVALDQTVSFHISGTGTLQELEDHRQPVQAAPQVRPGGGLSPPIDASVPLHEYRWHVLASLIALMTAGSAYAVMLRPTAPACEPNGLYQGPTRPLMEHRRTRRDSQHQRRVRV